MHRVNHRNSSNSPSSLTQISADLPIKALRNSVDIPSRPRCAPWSASFSDSEAMTWCPAAMFTEGREFTYEKWDVNMKNIGKMQM
jgi:hypothetical protein